MKINPVSTSFGSSFRVQLSPKSYAALGLYSFDTDDCYVHDREYNDPMLLGSGFYGEIVADADDKYDEEIEKFLASKGIEFEKIPSSNLLKPEIFSQKIKMNPSEARQNYKLVYIDTEKFDPIFSVDSIYVSPNGEYITIEGDSTESDIEKEKKCYQEAISEIQSGRDIEAPMANFQERQGVLLIGFPRGKYRYAAMRDLGLKYIPFSMTEKSEAVAKSFGLVKE